METNFIDIFMIACTYCGHDDGEDLFIIGFNQLNKTTVKIDYHCQNCGREFEATIAGTIK